jgi:hypothetical protein
MVGGAFNKALDEILLEKSCLSRNLFEVRNKNAWRAGLEHFKEKSPNVKVPR